jgi:hypothetical protein
MGASLSYQNIHFEELSEMINNNSSSCVIINTLPLNEQNCLIKYTLNGNIEVEIINNLIKQDKTKKIIIYGRNYRDISIYKKYKQLKTLGFVNVVVYIGGLFEWLCLQDIYGINNFQTIGTEVDILKYK